MPSFSQRLDRLQRNARQRLPPWPAQREVLKQGLAKANPSLSADEIEQLMQELDGFRATYDQIGPQPQYAKSESWMSGYVPDMSDSLADALLAVGRMLYGNQP